MKLILLLILFCTSAFAEKKILTDLEIDRDFAPYEMKLVLDHLKDATLTGIKENNLLTSMLAVNSKLSIASEVNSIFFFKSEFYKIFLDNKILDIASSSQISTSHIINIKNKFKIDMIVYTSLSQFIIQSVLDDISPFLRGNFLNNYKNLTKRKSSDMQKILKLKKILKYLSPWILAIDSLEADEFNKLVTKISLQFTDELKQKATYFREHQRFSSKIKHGPIFLNISTTLLQRSKMKALKEKKQRKAKLVSTSDQQQRTKLQAVKDLKGIKVNKMEGANAEIDQIIDSLETP